MNEKKKKSSKNWVQMYCSPCDWESPRRPSRNQALKDWDAHMKQDHPAPRRRSTWIRYVREKE